MTYESLLERTDLWKFLHIYFLGTKTSVNSDTKPSRQLNLFCAISRMKIVFFFFFFFENLKTYLH